MRKEKNEEGGGEKNLGGEEGGGASETGGRMERRTARWGVRTE